METAQARVQDAVTKMLSDLDRDHLRKMQGDMYRCSARCCDNPHYSMEDTQKCVDQCSVPVNKTQSYIQNELQSYQGRLQRCAMDCQDQVRDAVGPNTKEAEVAKYRGQMESCVLKCVDVHLGLIPNMMKRMKETLQGNHS